MINLTMGVPLILEAAPFELLGTKYPIGIVTHTTSHFWRYMDLPAYNMKVLNYHNGAEFEVFNLKIIRVVDRRLKYYMPRLVSTAVYAENDTWVRFDFSDVFSIVLSKNLEICIEDHFTNVSQQFFLAENPDYSYLVKTLLKNMPIVGNNKKAAEIIVHIRKGMNAFV